jgi:energy-coupling factor transporter ATP-binding protein EcfA2
MNKQYRSFFGLTREPFAADLAQNEILETEAVTEVKTRFDYVVRLGAIGLVTGEIGSGKSTALRFASGSLHPSEYQVFSVKNTVHIVPVGVTAEQSAHPPSILWLAFSILIGPPRQIRSSYIAGKATSVMLYISRMSYSATITILLPLFGTSSQIFQLNFPAISGLFSMCFSEARTCWKS